MRVHPMSRCRPCMIPAVPLVVMALLLSGCEDGDAPPAPPDDRVELPEPRTPAPADGDGAAEAREAFRSAFEGGAYEALPDLIRLLTAAYLDAPRDPATTLLLAHAHLWRAAESDRLEEPDPRITEHLVLAERYFEEAYRLRPSDHRILGWLASVRMPLGRVHADPDRVEEGYRLLGESVRRYPEFNHFTAGFALARYPAEHERFHEALEHMWANIERCSGATADVEPPASAYDRARQADPACANTPGAPHNFEGFMLTLGDMLLKAGRPEQAREAYGRARTSPRYAEWPYRGILEERMERAPELAERFRHGEREGGPPPGQGAGTLEEPKTVFGSGYSCAVCHARGGSDRPSPP